MSRAAKMDPPGLVFEVPIDTQGGDNKRECWQAKARRQKREKEAVGTICTAYRPAEGTTLRSLLRLMAVRGPLDMRLVRLYTGTRPRDPHNLGSRLKGIIDGLAVVFGIDDGDKRIRYVTDQERAKMPGIRVEVSARKPEVQGPGWTAEEWREVAEILRVAPLTFGATWNRSILVNGAEEMARALGGGG